MFRNLMENLSKKQKIAIVVILQAIVILLLYISITVAFEPKTHVGIKNEGDVSVPAKEWNGIKNELWYLIQNNVSNANKTDIDDAEIREGSYSEVTENNITTAIFILDIDSLKQSYVVTVAWSDKVELSDTISIDCPQQSEMKYPETVCHGMTNDTYSLDLYLPYAVYPEGYDDENSEPLAPDIYIYGDENDKTIEIMVSTCDADRFKNEAMEYLNSTPIKLFEYTINYEVNNINVRC